MSTEAEADEDKQAEIVRDISQHVIEQCTDIIMRGCSLVPPSERHWLAFNLAGWAGAVSLSLAHMDMGGPPSDPEHSVNKMFGPLRKLTTQNFRRILKAAEDQ